MNSPSPELCACVCGEVCMCVFMHVEQGHPPLLLPASCLLGDAVHLESWRTACVIRAHVFCVFHQSS